MSLTFGQLSAENLLKVFWVDVEGGAATLIISPAGESILIDTGNPGVRDPGRINKLAREEAGISKIDHLVITHFDGDHFGGAADLANLISIGTVYDQGVRPQERERVGERYLHFPCDTRLTLTPGDELPLKQTKAGPKLTATVLGVLQRNVEPNSQNRANPFPKDYQLQEPDLSYNANSIVLLFEYGDWQFLDAADLTWNLEGRLISPYNLIGEIDVYQVDHHGLDRSNNTHFIHSLKPAVAVMNNAHKKGLFRRISGSAACLNSDFVENKTIKALHRGGLRRSSRKPYKCPRGRSIGLPDAELCWLCA